MPEFGETAGEFVRNIIRSLQEEAERLPSPAAMMDLLKEMDPSPEQIGAFAGKCVEAAVKAGKDMAQGVREASTTLFEPPDFEVPDDLSDLG